MRALLRNRPAWPICILYQQSDVGGPVAGESAQIVETIQPAITLLGLGIGAALVSRACRFNPIVGYLALGFALAVLGYADMFSGPVVSAMAEAGVMFLLFNLGLHFSLGRIRDEAANIFGFGALQMLVAGGGFALLFYWIGLPVEFAVIGGFAMGLSSTAVVIGLVRERDQQDCPVGRAAQSILIFQDIAAIALLVAAGSLASGGAIGHELAIAGLKALAAFVVAVLFARFLTERLFRLIARLGSSEVYTATALFIALAAGWATGLMGLSLTLGAFLGGMAVADSRYRIMVEAEIDAFRGLFLSFFFISVGLTINPAIVAENWALVIGAAALLIVLKCLFNVFAGLANRWSVPGSIQLGFLLGQGSEFALVIFALPAVYGFVEPVEPRLIPVLISAIAISLAVTPLVSNIGRKLAGKLRRGPADEKLAGDNAPVLIIGLGTTGRAVADALHFNNIDYLGVEPDPDRFEVALADGYDVHQANPGDPRSWEPLGMARREVVVIATGKLSVAREVTPLVQELGRDYTRVIALPGPEGLREFSELGLIPVDVTAPRGTEEIIDIVFDSLGRERHLPVSGKFEERHEEQREPEAA